MSKLNSIQKKVGAIISNLESSAFKMASDNCKPGIKSSNQELVEASRKQLHELIESEFSEVIHLLERAGTLVGHPCTNISSGTDIACMDWQLEYEQYKIKE